MTLRIRYSSRDYFEQCIHRLLTYFVIGSIPLQLVDCFTGLDSTKQVNLLSIQYKQSSCIKTSETGCQPCFSVCSK